IEMLYHPLAPETPNKLLSLSVVAELMRLLPRSQREPENEEIRQRLQVVAFGSLFSILAKGGLGLSHSMGMFSRNGFSMHSLLFNIHFLCFLRDDSLRVLMVYVILGYSL